MFQTPRLALGTKNQVFLGKKFFFQMSMYNKYNFILFINNYLKRTFKIRKPIQNFKIINKNRISFKFN